VGAEGGGYVAKHLVRLAKFIANLEICGDISG